MKQGIFITGTDTGVGKTVVAAALTTILRSTGYDAAPMKPVQTGFADRDDSPDDLTLCLHLSGLAVSEQEKTLMQPYTFLSACSPHLAAAKTRDTIDIDYICSCAEDLLRHHERVLLEGAGGVQVPLDDRKTMLDLMTALAWPVVVTARPGLGTINHTLLTLNQLQRADLPITGVVFCETETTIWSDVENDNWWTIEHFAGVPVLGRVPYFADLSSGKLSSEVFSNEVSRTLSFSKARSIGEIK